VTVSHPPLGSLIVSALPPAPPRPSLGRVLVIDDEPAVGGMVQAVLTEFGYAVKHAGNGVEGLRLIRLFEPNGVLLDLKMPGTSGLEVLDYLRRDFPELPVVILSGNDDAGIARATLRGGAFDYIQKPFNIDVLARVVAAAIGSVSGGR
jgi:DNA-binding response OmpR family regulator